MIYEKSVAIQGKWLKGKDVESGTKAKLVSETVPVPSSFKNDKGEIITQNIAKIKVSGLPEVLNMNVNKQSLNALIDAFGKDSVEWIDKVITLESMRSIVGGKVVYPIYLIPEGYHLKETETGFLLISKIEDDNLEEVPTIDVDDNVIREKDLPF